MNNDSIDDIRDEHDAQYVKELMDRESLKEFLKPTLEQLSYAETAMDRWVMTYAPEFCNEVDVNNARAAMWDAGGQLAYMTDIRVGLEKEIARLTSYFNEHT